MNGPNSKIPKQIPMSVLLVKMDEKLSCLFDSIYEIEEALQSLEAMMVCVFPHHSGAQDE